MKDQPFILVVFTFDLLTQKEDFMHQFRKTNWFIFFNLFFIFPVFSQSDKVQFGAIPKEDLASKFSSLDKNAEAEVLHESYDVNLSLFGGRLEITIKSHTRIKIYNEKGLDEANIKIPYISRAGAEGIFKLEGQTYNQDESGNMTTSKLEKKSIYNKKINNRLSNQILTFPEVKAGSIIEYKYTLKRTLLYFDDWTFQRNIPVRYSNCTIEYPSEFSFSHIALTTLPVEIDQKQSGYAMRKSFTMRNLPALKDEPFMSSADDYLQQVQFNLSGYFSPQLTVNLTTTWPEIIKELMEDEDFGVQLKKDIPKTAELDDKLKALNTDFAKMTSIYNYTREKMLWDGDYSIWALGGVKSAWSEKKGNSGEINLIMINLLKNAGLNANPLLVSTRSHGKLNTLDPNINQFNTVMALVKIDSTTYVLDATDKETPSHLIPERVMYTEGLVINKFDLNKVYTAQDFGWVTIWDDRKKYGKLVNISAELDTEGNISGQAFILNSDYARLSTLKAWKADKEEFQKELSNVHASMKITDFIQKNEDKDSLALESKFKFKLQANESGEYQYFSINLFNGLEKNPFIADERSSDIMFGVNQKVNLGGLISIPAGYTFEELPKNIKLIMPDKSIIMTRAMQLVGNKVNYAVTIEFAKPFYSVEDYPELQAFYKKMFELLNEQIVIRKAKS